VRCYGVKGQAGTEASGTFKLNSSRGVAWVWRISSHVVLWQRACAGAGEVGTFGGNNKVQPSQSLRQSTGLRLCLPPRYTWLPGVCLTCSTPTWGTFVAGLSSPTASYSAVSARIGVRGSLWSINNGWNG
jgi:hypothetical protein